MKRLISCAILVLVCGWFPGVLWAQVLDWDVDECYTTNFDDVLMLKNAGYEPFGTPNTFRIIDLTGIWQGLDQYVIGVKGVGYTRGNIRKSLPGTNDNSGFFGGNIDCGIAIEITRYVPQQTGTFRLQCGGTATPFQVSGTVARVDCGAAVAMATSRQALSVEQASRGLAGELRNNEDK